MKELEDIIRDLRAGTPSEATMTKILLVIEALNLYMDGINSRITDQHQAMHDARIIADKLTNEKTAIERLVYMAAKN